MAFHVSGPLSEPGGVPVLNIEYGPPESWQIWT
jgi:hypothetical protein